MDTHAPQNAARERLVSKNFLVALVEKIVHLQNRRKMPGDIVRCTGVDVFVAGIARDSEGEIGVLPLAHEAATHNERPALGRDSDRKGTGIARPANERLADAGI